MDRTRKLFDKNGLPIHPERSIYYDPVMNPFGVPPPGMPYIERRTSRTRPFTPSMYSDLYFLCSFSVEAGRGGATSGRGGYE